MKVTGLAKTVGVADVAGVARAVGAADVAGVARAADVAGAADAAGAAQAVGGGLRIARLSRTVYLPTIVIAVVGAWLSWRGWSLLSQYGVGRTVNAGRYELAGPVVLSFVFVVCVIERFWPAQRRPLLARGHLLDVCYLLFYALLVVPLVVLLGTGFGDLLAREAPWLVLPRLPDVPRWCFIVVAVLAIDAMDWLAHYINHRITMFWRLHAVHHSQEELSILTTYRAHPLVHVSFLFSAIPVFAIESNAATPAVVLTVYACLGALPHANVRWNYGIAGRVFISPAYHRIHHRATGRLDINLGTVFTLWDVVSRRAVFPYASARQPASVTGLAGRPIPVEQAGRLRLGRTLLIQLAEPFTPIRTESR
ncbi:MAG TPA: sterol desaturase family protein [Streptosporangiaceae bacterium]|nr:sterol desaturase family protein [Streptosporangiaceae bacterium]